MKTLYKIAGNSGFHFSATLLQGHIHTLVDRKDCTPALLWSKTTRTTGGVGGTWEDPPTCKMRTFFLIASVNLIRLQNVLCKTEFMSL